MPNFLVIPAPNKQRGNKIKVHDKVVTHARKQEMFTQNLRKTQSRMDGIRSEQEQTTDRSSSNAQTNSQEAMSAPGNVANRRRIYTTRIGLMSYGLGSSWLKRGKRRDNTSGLTGVTTPPLNPRNLHPRRVLGSSQGCMGPPIKSGPEVEESREGSGGWSVIRSCLFSWTLAFANVDHLPFTSASATGHCS